jgi:alpha-galactosidase
MKANTLFVLSFFIATVLAIENGLGRTPQMGWNSWNKFGCNVTETVIRQTIDQFVALQLPKYGYNYINIDDCWAGSRDEKGFVQADEKTFPSGIKSLADYAHSKGLKFGIYSDSGNYTCAGRPGSLGYEYNDAKSYASWGVDYLKYDNCWSSDAPAKPRYITMAKALRATGSNIFFSLCEWGVEDPTIWAPKISNSWRTTADIKDDWDSMMMNLIVNDGGAKFAGPGAWNDPDMLEVGNGGMNFEMYKSHFSLWCIVKAPLLIGCDLTNITKETLTILTNTEAIEVNQDSLGIQGRMVSNSRGRMIFTGPLSGEAFAIVVVAVSEASGAPFELDLNELFGSGLWLVRDLWAHKNLGKFQDSITISGLRRGFCVFYRISRY